MNIFAAIDLRGGAAVQLVGGDPGNEPIRLPDPAAVARRWLERGFRHLHVVDLDAALGTGDNREAIAAIAATAGESGTDALAGRGSGPRAKATLQVGGGVRDTAAVERLLDLGADRVVAGTRAVEDRAWLEAAATAHPDRIVVAADVRADRIVTRGWTKTTDRDAAAFITGLDPLPLAGVLVTDVGREGQQAGIDIDRFRALTAATRHPLIAAGGITDPADLGALAGAGAAGAVLGMALYSGRLDPAAALNFEETE